MGEGRHITYGRSDIKLFTGRFSGNWERRKVGSEAAQGAETINRLTEMSSMNAGGVGESFQGWRKGENPKEGM